METTLSWLPKEENINIKLINQGQTFEFYQGTILYNFLHLNTNWHTRPKLWKNTFLCLIFFNFIRWKPQYRAWWKRQPDVDSRPVENLSLVDVNQLKTPQCENLSVKTSVWSELQLLSRSLSLSSVFTKKLRFSTGRRQPDWGFQCCRRWWMVDLVRQPSTLSTLSTSIFTDVFITLPM